MTDIIELKRSNLVLPSSGYELDQEEMSYVEGGMSLWTRIGIIAACVGVAVVVGAAIATGTFFAVAALMKMTFAAYVKTVGAAAVTKIILSTLGGSAVGGVTIAGILIG